MSDFERVERFFGDAAFKDRDSYKLREVKLDLGSAAIYWAGIELDHPSPPETFKLIPVEANHSLTVRHQRSFWGFHRKKFVDIVLITQRMGGEGMFEEDGEALYGPEDVAEFRLRHNITAGSTLSRLGMSPPHPNVVSNFQFDMKGQLHTPSYDNVAGRDRFNNVMDYLEAQKVAVS